MILIKIFLAGVIVLIGAILLNWLAGVLSLPSWYDFLSSKTKLNFYSITWLFLLYPLGLGALAYLAYLVIFTRL